MTEATWSWILVGFELVAIGGMWMVGARKWWGWGLVLTSSLPWMVYAIVFNKPGFVVMSSIYIITHSNNLYRWRKRHVKDAQDTDSQEQSSLLIAA